MPVDEATHRRVDSEQANLSLDQKILDQVEFYFGSENMAKDPFMQRKVKEQSGWLTMSTMMRFNRLSKICNDKDYIVDVLRRKSTMIEVSNTGLSIRRNPSYSGPK